MAPEMNDGQVVIGVDRSVPPHELAVVPIDPGAQATISPRGQKEIVARLSGLAPDAQVHACALRLQPRSAVVRDGAAGWRNVGRRPRRGGSGSAQADGNGQTECMVSSSGPPVA